MKKDGWDEGEFKILFITSFCVFKTFSKEYIHRKVKTVRVILKESHTSGGDVQTSPWRQARGTLHAKLVLRTL